jgi:hypothetical protein
MRSIAFNTSVRGTYSFAFILEWIDPITDHPGGSFPFRTGISAVRAAIADIIQRINRGHSISAKAITRYSH